jgi:subtilisin family serine protease
MSDQMKQELIVPISVALEQIGADELHRKGITGKGVRVAVLDTGVDATHPMLRDAVVGVANFTPYPSRTNNDGQGHGTWCAAAIAGRPVLYKGQYGEHTLMGVAPEAEILDVKVLGDDGGGSMSDVIKGIEWAVKNGATILSMSLGSLVDGAGIDPVSRFVNEVTRKYGVICVVAAGNSFGNFLVGSPGGALEALTVGSVALRSPTFGTVATFSSKGPTTDGRIKPNIACFGGNMGPVGEKILTATSGKAAEETGERYSGMMGTSMATPIVAGGLALLQQAGAPMERKYVESLLAQSAKMPHPPDVWTGWGIFNVAKAHTLIGTQLLPLQRVQNVQNLFAKPLAGPASKIYSLFNNEQKSNGIPRLPL